MNHPTNGKNEGAALYVLSRMVADPRLAWLIGPGSTAYDRLTAEAAAQRGQTQEEFCAIHEPLLKFEPWPRTEEPAGVSGTQDQTFPHQSPIPSLKEE